MAEVVTGEEDVEIGRCVTNHIHIECTHAWEVSSVVAGGHSVLLKFVLSIFIHLSRESDDGAIF